ncbi:MAG: hypothetical protein PHD48_00475 [Alphaproteobacteria bacterium]|nr:hypothetical protein [Alphaproteobacteria bacterium]
MKIAAKISMTALTTLFSLILVSGSGVWAQDTSAVAPGPSSSQVSSSVKEALDSISVPGSSLSVQKEKSKQSSKFKTEDDGEETAYSLSSGNVPKSVTSVVKNLSETTEQVTLENLNAAREAVIKLDVLIDIEKRLNDLAKLRKAREEDSMLIESSLPRSALAPSPTDSQIPPLSSYGASGTGSAHSFSGASSADVEVLRITGAASRFAAQIKDASGSDKLVHVGDKLSDGSKITAISAYGVSVIRSDKSRETFAVKDAPALFVSQ